MSDLKTVFERKFLILYEKWIIYNYLLFKNRIFLQHVSNFYSSSGNEREQKIILVEKVDTKTVIWQNGLSENLPN